MNEIDHHFESRKNRVLYLQLPFRSNLESDVSLLFLLQLPMNLRCQYRMMIQRKEREEV